MKLPTLYKKNTNGSLQFWEIEVKCIMDGLEVLRWEVQPPVKALGVVITRYGQLGTDSPQVTQDTVTEGKNVGKANATTAYEQAEKEAQAKWTKQKKKGYVESKEAAEAGETDEVIQGGLLPMLAQKYKDHAKKIKFPCYVQPKLDGMRCIAILKDGKCTLWSRTRKPIHSCPHIIKEIEDVFAGSDLVLDGELYNHDLRDDLEAIISLARQDEPAPGHETIQYHVYDLPGPGTFTERLGKLSQLFLDAGSEGIESIKLVPTKVAENAEDLDAIFQSYLEERYEGAMARNADGLYVPTRSYDLQKLKAAETDEFTIVGAEDGRGKMAGLLARFVCVTKDGHEFKPPFNAPLPKLKSMYENRASFIGKQLTVRYLRYSHTDKPVPYGCKGLTVRDYE